MARVGIEIDVTGPLFDKSSAQLEKTVRRAVDEGAEELTIEGASLAYDLAPAVTGGFRSSITVINKNREDMFAWAHANPYGRGTPGAISTWLETGKRRGVKTRRRGRYMFRTSFKRINQVDKADFFLPRIVEALGGS